MEFKKFAFEPEDGFRNTDFYEDSPSDSREILQRQHDMTRDYINSVVSLLSSEREGESGSEHIGSPAIPGVSGKNVYEQLSDMKRQITDYAGGTIPDGTVGEKKLADGCVTSQKLSPGSVSDEHFRGGAKIGISVTSENLNGYPAEDYCPLRLGEASGSFKERMTSEKVVSVVGKTHNGKRYMLQEDGTIKIFDLEEGEFCGKLDFSEYSLGFRIAFDDDGVLYFAKTTNESQYGYVYLYKYSDGEVTQLARIKVMKIYTYGFVMTDMEIMNGYAYLGIVYYGDTVELMRIPLAEVESITEASPFYTFKTKVEDIRLVKKNGNLYCAGKCFINGYDDEVITFCANILEDGPGNLMLASGDFSFVSDENYPEITSTGSFDPAQSFWYGKYIYTLKSGYIFRGRII